MSLSLLVILFCLFPGIIFRLSYKRGSAPVFYPVRYGPSGGGKWPTDNKPVTEEITSLFTASLMLHIGGLTAIPWLLHSLGTLYPDLPFHPMGTSDYYFLFSTIVTDTKSASQHDEIVRFLAESRHGLVAYFLVLSMTSVLLGRWSVRMVRGFKLDHDLMQLRLNDPWFYLLTGGMLSFAEIRRLNRNRLPPVTATYVSVVVTHSAGDYLCNGFLLDFHLDRRGGLDRLVLHNVIRSRLEPPTRADKQQSLGVSDITDAHSQFRQVSSQIFTVKYADCRTLACTYIYVREKGADEQEQSPNSKR